MISPFKVPRNQPLTLQWQGSHHDPVDPNDSSRLQVTCVWKCMPWGRCTKGFLVAEAAGRDSEKEQLGTNLRLFEAISSHSRHHMASLAPIGSWVATCQIVPGGRAYWELYHLRHTSIAQENKKQHKIFQWGIISKPTSYTFLISNWVL